MNSLALLGTAVTGFLRQAECTDLRELRLSLISGAGEDSEELVDGSPEWIFNEERTSVCYKLRPKSLEITEINITSHMPIHTFAIVWLYNYGFELDSDISSQWKNLQTLVLQSSSTEVDGVAQSSGPGRLLDLDTLRL